jgi:hypothetical protein
VTFAVLLIRATLRGRGTMTRSILGLRNWGVGTKDQEFQLMLKSWPGEEKPTPGSNTTSGGSGAQPM